MIKIGLVGVGHLGKIHLQILKNIPQFEVIGIYDTDTGKARDISMSYEVPCFEDLNSLIAAAEAIDIVAPTQHHFAIAKAAIIKGLHVFVEKPLSTTVMEARTLVNLVSEAKVKVQVGHVERYNPAFLAIQTLPLAPRFIEVHRLAQWNERGLDVSVVQDLMIHDIDAILSIVKSKVQSLKASGVAVIGETADIANARIEFFNGCVANLTASRISMKNMRKMRLFQKNTYLTVDFLEKSAQAYQIFDAPPPENSQVFQYQLNGMTKYLSMQPLTVTPNNAIEEELLDFASAINNNTEPSVSVMEGLEAMDLAHQIVQRITHIPA